ncbi:MAG: hypothetical protein ACXVCY_07665 [Pseudobdellovibrionaceae bacterium]
MNLSLSLLNLQIQKPKDVSTLFKCCPACGSKDLIFIQPEVLCQKCDWETTLRSVQAGNMDHLFKAYKEQFKGQVHLSNINQEEVNP